MNFFTFNMSNFDPELLIKSVEQRPGLWDKSLDVFKNKSYRASAWREVSRLLNPEYDKLTRIEKNDYERLLQNKWTNIRDAYKKNILVQEAYRKSGSIKKPPRPYYYHEQLKFLFKNTNNIMIKQENINNYLEPFMSNSSECYETNSNNDDNPLQLTLNETSEDNTSQTTQDKDMSDMSTIDLKMIEFMDENMKQASKRDDENRHLLFFKSILPSLDSFSDEQTLIFQSNVLKLLQEMKNNGKLES